MAAGIAPGQSGHGAAVHRDLHSSGEDVTALRIMSPRERSRGLPAFTSHGDWPFSAASRKGETGRGRPPSSAGGRTNRHSSRAQAASLRKSASRWLRFSEPGEGGSAPGPGFHEGCSSGHRSAEPTPAPVRATAEHLRPGKPTPRLDVSTGGVPGCGDRAGDTGGDVLVVAVSAHRARKAMASSPLRTSVPEGPRFRRRSRIARSFSPASRMAAFTVRSVSSREILSRAPQEGASSPPFRAPAFPGRRAGPPASFRTASGEGERPPGVSARRGRAGVFSDAVPRSRATPP